MRRILIIKPQRIGDLLLLTPTLSALKNQVPDARIELLVRRSSAKILESFSKIVDRVWTITGESPDERLTDDALWDRHFDNVIELSGQPFAGKVLCYCKSHRKHHSILYESYGDILSMVERCSKLRSLSSWKNKHAMDKDRLVIGRALDLKLRRANPVFPVKDADFPILVPPIQEPFAVFQTLSDDPSRTWPHERWRTLAKRMLKEGRVKEIVFPFGPHDEGIRAAWIANGIAGCRVPLWGLTFDAHAALVQKAAICVTCHTGVMHVAAAVRKTPIVAIWGKKRIKKWYPLCAKFRIICKNEVFDEDFVRRKKVDEIYQQGSIKANSVRTVAREVTEILKEQVHDAASLNRFSNIP